MVDFLCSRARLVVELDGDQHGADQAMRYDAVRTEWLRQQGYSVLRFANGAVLRNRQMVIDAILHHLEEHDIPLPGNAAGISDPPPKGGWQRGGEMQRFHVKRH
ncbi:hypothetical protein GCM10008941_24260 [Rhizomicrobium palustre]